MYLHLVAHVGANGADLDARSSARLWTVLRRWAPTALACVVLPRSLEVIVRTRDRARARRGLARALNHVVRKAPGVIWQTPLDVPVLGGALAQHVRAVALRPCVEELCDDPLQWLWSTHRDVCGAVADAWVTGVRLARALGEPDRGFRLRHHAFVADPSGWTSPFPESSRAFGVDPADLLRAAEAACRWVPGRTPERTRRRLFFGVGRRTRLDIDALRAVLPTPRAAAFRRAVAATPAEVRCTLLCLGDTRLLHPTRPAARLSHPVEREAC